jgi:hypothetical protein
MKSMPLAVIVVTLTSPLTAQFQPPNPGPEHTRIATRTGTWQMEGEEEGIKYTGKETCELASGGFHVVCRREGKSALGTMAGQSIIGFDATEKMYTVYSISSFRPNGVSLKGTIDGPVMTLTGDISVNGRPVKLRVIETQESPNAYRYQTELALGGAPWEVIEEGRSIRVRQ